MHAKRFKDYQDAIEFIDYIVLCLECGHNIQQSFFMASNNLNSGHFQLQCFKVMQSYELGYSLSQSLSNSMEINSCPISKDVFENLSIALKFGTKVSKTLSELGVQIRLNMMTHLESLAQEVPVKMIFPLVMFIFPVIFILIGTKTFLDFIHSLGA